MEIFMSIVLGFICFAAFMAVYCGIGILISLTVSHVRCLKNLMEYCDIPTPEGGIDETGVWVFGWPILLGMLFVAVSWYAVRYPVYILNKHINSVEKSKNG